jgi:hypothetical protein
LVTRGVDLSRIALTLRELIGGLVYEVNFGCPRTKGGVSVEERWA